LPNAIRMSTELRSRTVRAASLAAGLVVDGADGVSYVLLSPRSFVFRKRTPVVLRCAPKDAEGIRVALGIERSGRGVFEWETQPSLFDRAQLIARVASAFAVLGAGIAAAMLPRHDSYYPFAIAFWSVLVSIVAWFLASLLPKTTLLLSPEGLVIPIEHGSIMIGRADLRSAKRTQKDLAIEARTKHVVPLRTSRSARGLADADRDVLALVIDAVAKTKPIEERDPLSVLLERGRDSTERWLLRLDTLTAGGADAYRSVLGGVERVLKVLESPDEHPDVRMGAARILTHTSPDIRKRVDIAVSAIADDGLRDRVRIAMADDPTKAAEVLDADDRVLLETREPL
jgi:hypothetical protein